GLERFEHRRRSAAIEVRVLRRLGDDRFDVEETARALVVEMELRRAHGFERLQKGHVGARAAGVIELPSAAGLVQPLQHAPNPGDSDASCQQQHGDGGLYQRKSTARYADL